jgi:hypothetical protein
MVNLNRCAFALARYILTGNKWLYCQKVKKEKLHLLKKQDDSFLFYCF